MGDSGALLAACPHCGEVHPEEVLLCPVRAAVLPLEGRILDGKFRFLRQLGEGGMSTVWMAENRLVHKRVAIKLMHPELAHNPRTLARFRNEATAAGRIGSAHICDILDFGQSPLGPYIVMEALRGASFGELLERAQRLEPGLAALIIRQGLEGLDAAHRTGIIHRDLKPENLFIHEPEPGRMTVKLMDFGISKFTEEIGGGKTGVGVLMGTPEYMSPEQAEGAANVDERTDIWAMGVMLYRAVTGVDAFAGPTLAATLLAVTTKQPRPVLDLVPEVPVELVRVIERCLAKSPQDRYANCAELSAALAPFEEHMSLPPDGAGSYLQSAVKRITSSERTLPTPQPDGARAVDRAAPTAAAAYSFASLGPTPAAQQQSPAPPQQQPQQPPSPPPQQPPPPPVARHAPTAPDARGGERGATWSNELEGARGAEQSWTMGAEEVDDRPRAGKGGGGVLVPILGVVAVLALAGGGVLAWRYGVFDRYLVGAVDTDERDAGAAVADVRTVAEVVDVGSAAKPPLDAGAGEPGTEGDGDPVDAGTRPVDAGVPPGDGEGTDANHGDGTPEHGDDKPPENGEKPTGPQIQLSKLYRAGSLYTQKKIPPASDYEAAEAFCRKLKSSRHAGLRKWRLASGSEALSFKSKGVTKTKYWTSRKLAGKAWTVNLFSGDQAPLAVTTKGPRPFCVSAK